MIPVRVLKFNVPVDNQWHPVGGGPVLHVGCQDAVVVAVWTLEDGSADHSRTVRVFGTGYPLPNGVEHVGTAVAVGGRLVWHLFATSTSSERPA